MQKGQALIFLIVGILVIVLAGGAYYLGTKKSPSQPQVTNSPLNSESNDVSSEINNFPIYPSANFINKEKQAECEGEVSGFSICGSTTYTWETNDKFTQVSNWYKNGQNGWSCSGGAGSYDSENETYGRTSCAKGDLKYNLDITTTSGKTTITLLIRQKQTTDETTNWRLYTNSEKGYSVKYPAEAFLRLICPNEELTLDERSGWEQYSSSETLDMPTCARGGRYDIEIQTYPPSAIETKAPQADENYNVTKENITIDGVLGDKYTITTTANCVGMCSPAFRVEIYLAKGNNTYSFYLWNKNYLNIFNNMLSTFKFTK